MKKLLAVGVLLVFSFALMAFTFEGGEPYKIGDVVENFELMGVDGKAYDLYSHLDKEGSKGVLLMLVSWRCPISNNCNERMVELGEFTKKNNIAMLGMNPNSIFYDGSNEKIKQEADKAGFNFPVLRDMNAMMADKFKMAATPTAVLIGKDKKIYYRGRIDDQHGRVGRPQKPIEDHTLMNTLNAFLAGEEITVTDTRSPGCSIKRLSQYYEGGKK